MKKRSKKKYVRKKREKKISICLKKRNLISNNTATGKGNGKKNYKKKWLNLLINESRH